MTVKEKEKIAKEFLKILTKDKKLFSYGEREIWWDKKGETRLTKPRIIKLIYPEFESIGLTYFKNMLKKAIDNVLKLPAE